MQSHYGVSERSAVGKAAAHTLWALVVIVSLLFVTGWSLYIKSTECFEDCDGFARGYTGGDFRYTGQLATATVGTLMGLAAVVSGFGRRAPSST